jgi:RHS repeat-associated protein
VEYEYDADGNRTKMTDGTGKTTYTFDQLDRLTETVDGHDDTVKYEYDLADEQTKVTYPNGKTAERSYDKAGRLHSVTDWLAGTTTFTYNPDSGVSAITFPTATGDHDSYTYTPTDLPVEAKMSKGEETLALASLLYTRDNSNQITRTVSKSLPGAETSEYAYDENERLTQAGSGSVKYSYDAANNPTVTPGSANTFDTADELTEGTGVKYSYDEQGERTKTTPTTGPATTYGYNQAGDLTSVARPEEGVTPKIEDSYAYNGDGLRVSQTITGKTSYLAWDTAEGLPLILNDGTDSYIYGPNGLPFEQINTKEEPTYLHHDQAGSTRLLTSSTGTVVGSYTYTPYGATESHTGTATTPLGYDGQYTSSDTGLIYLRARVYDPATAQFLSRDPLTAVTGAPYTYAGDNPLTYGDPTGLSSGSFLEEVGEGIAGWGDTLTFGATNWIREELGINNVLSCSGAYEAGGIAGLATAALIPGEGEAEIGAEEAGAELATTPAGRPYSAHYLDERGPERNIPGSVVDETIEHGEVAEELPDRTVYYDPKNDVTTVLSKTTGKIISARRGTP